jgi:hypothetical protein
LGTPTSLPLPQKVKTCNGGYLVVARPIRQNLQSDRLWCVARQNFGDNANGRKISRLLWTHSNCVFTPNAKFFARSQFRRCSEAFWGVLRIAVDHTTLSSVVRSSSRQWTEIVCTKYSDAALVWQRHVCCVLNQSKAACVWRQDAFAATGTDKRNQAGLLMIPRNRLTLHRFRTRTGSRFPSLLKTKDTTVFTLHRRPVEYSTNRGLTNTELSWTLGWLTLCRLTQSFRFHSSGYALVQSTRGWLTQGCARPRQT